MKKFISVLLTASLIVVLAACGENEDKTTTTAFTSETTAQTTSYAEENEKLSYEDIPDTMSTENNKYEIAFVTGVGQLLDKSFNQGTWEGVKKFAYDNKKSYKYYQPANADQTTDTDRYNAMKAAVQAGAKVLVCSGYLQSNAIARAAAEFPEVYFIFIDGQVVEDESKNILSNVAAVDFREEQSGFLAGYAAVKEGYKKLGFIGGGGGTNPSCCRFGYGYVQGAESAAKEKGVEVEMTYSWEYGASFSPSAELQTMLQGWYAKGTEVVFSCGGPMCQSAFAAASANDAAVIGADVDQSAESDTVITSATKGIRESVEILLSELYDGKWEKVGGKQTTLGAAEDAVGLPTKSWKFKNFSQEEYEAVYQKLKDGTLTPDRDYEKMSPEIFSSVKLTVV